MTRNEAIELLEDVIGSIEDNQGRDYDTAFRMAIEALQFVEHFDLLKEYQSLQEVVQCKDCRHWDEKDQYCTDGGGLIIGVTENDFCSKGERREE